MFTLAEADKQSRSTSQNGKLIPPGANVAELNPGLEDRERSRIPVEWNDTVIDYPEACLHQLFEQQVELYPHADAVVCEGQRLSYRQLNERANRLGQYLRGIGVGPDILVGLYVERSVEAIVGILGILKAGGAYVPIDTTFPQDRIGFMLGDAEVRLLLTQTTLAPSVPDSAVRLITLDTFDWTAPDGQVFCPLAAGPGNLAYVIYTSGSTGTPKGVCIEHRNIVNYVRGVSERLGFKPGMNHASVSTIAADLGNTVVFGALATGGCLHILSHACAESQAAISDYFNREKIDVLKIVPSHLAGLMTGQDPQWVLPRQRLILGGEASRVGWIESLRGLSPSCQIYNHYGPTETTVGVLTYHVESHMPDTDSGTLPLGRPLPNCETYILRADGKPVSIGEVGELWIGGSGVARGYLNREALTAERFVRNPFQSRDGDRLYRTGDRGRYLPSGDIEFCGRLDYQVKIRGYRVELGEIETVLGRQPGIREAVVLAREDQAGIQQLVGYVVPKQFPQPLWENKSVCLLPDGFAVAHLNKNETDYIYNEIFVLQAYLRHGIAVCDGDYIVDAGSNIGLFTVFASRLAKDLHIYSFEPNPDAFRCLQANAESWCTGVECMPCGLSRENSSAEMTIFEGLSLLSGFHADAAQERRVVEAFTRNHQSDSVPEERLESEIDKLLDERFRATKRTAQLRTLSTIIAEKGIDHIDLLKVNVEKSELDVLEGIAEHDWPKIRQLVIEVDQQANLGPIIALLNRYGYEFVVEQDSLLSGTDLCYVYAVRPSTERNRLVREESPQAHLRVAPMDASRGVTPLGLRKQLKDQLPQYMIPSAFVLLEKLPLTANGKIDRTALPAPPFVSSTTTPDSLQPRTDTERSLAAIWKEVLRIGDVSIHDDFFDLGGHSLLAIKAIARIHDTLGFDLPAQMLFENPTIAGVAEVLSKSQGGEKLATPRIRRREHAGPCPLSLTQRPQWFLHQLNPASPVYNIVDVIQLDGRYNAGALRRALNELTRRHEILRTSFVERNEEPMQIVLPEITLIVAERDWISLCQQQQQSAWTDLVREQGRKPFDLSRPPLLRATVAHCGEQEHRLLITIHHIIADEWSMEIIQRELQQLYRAFSLEQPSPLAELPLQYADFACWQQDLLQSGGLREQLRFWKRELAGAPFVLELPADKPRAANQSFRGATQMFSLGADRLQAIKSLAREERATLFMALEAGFAALLHRYTDREDVLIGTPVSNRAQSQTQVMVGCFLNSVVLRAQFTGEMSFRSLLRQVRERALSAYANCDVPFDQLVAELAPERDASHSPLFQVMFVLHAPGGVSQVSKASGNHMLETGTSKCDLTLMLSESDQGLEGVIEYNTDLFTEETIGRIGGHYATFLSAAVQNPGQRIDSLPLLTDAERRKLLVDWNDTAAEYPKFTSLAELLEAQVKRTPDTIAVVAGEQQLTFRELNTRANQLAYTLRKHGAGAEQAVGVLLNRSTDLVVALLAIVKSGAAYLPLDPLFPAGRLAYMLEDSGARLLVTEQSLLAELPGFVGTSILLDDEGWNANSKENLGLPEGPEDLAYLIYTSGSTGKPKGVQVERGALKNFLWSMRKWLQLSPRDRLLAVTTISFDIAGLEIWLPLLAGARIVIASRESAADGNALRDLIDHHDITFLQGTPATWRLLFDSGWAGKANLQAVCGGEAMPAEVATRLVPAVQRVWNLYGPTETTVWSTGLCVTEGQASIPIGRPIANTQIYIVDSHRQPMPMGVPGELCIGGDGVARGYLNRPELTAEKFVPDPFRGGKARMYRTGDLARWLPDGTIECQGRLDHQVKLRGFRIELGEIEAQLSKHEAVREVVVMAREDTPGDKRLVAYYTGWQDGVGRTARLTSKEFRAYLSAALPDYMIPTAYVLLDALPLTPNGKLDRKAYPRPDQDSDAASTRTAPASDIERQIAAIWKDVLKIQHVGRDSNFFDLGGHSLLVMKVQNQLRKIFDRNISVVEMFRYVTVRTLAQYLSGKRSEDAGDNARDAAADRKETMRRQRELRQALQQK